LKRKDTRSSVEMEYSLSCC